MAFSSSGSLTTDKREIAVSGTWDTQTEWDAYQSKNNVVINNGILQLADVSIPTNGLIHRYKFNDTTDGTVAVDSEGTRDGTINGAAYSTDVKEGSNALSFDGTDDYVDLGTGIFDTTSSFSVCLWVKFSSLTSDQRIFTTRSDVNTILTQGRSASDSTEMWIDGTDYQLGTVTTGTYYHLSYTYDESNTAVTGYFNGSEAASTSQDITSGSGSMVGFGSDTSHTSNFLAGIVDETLIYNRELSANEVSDIYKSY